MASRSVNKVMLIGNLGRDAETKFTPSGVAATRFSVATSRRWKDKESDEWKEDTNWTNVVLWRAENLASYLLKGKQVYVPCDLLNARPPGQMAGPARRASGIPHGNGNGNGGPTKKSRPSGVEVRNSSAC